MHKFEIDALFALLVAELAVIFFILTIILFIKNRRLKKQIAKLKDFVQEPSQAHVCTLTKTESAPATNTTEQKPITQSTEQPITTAPTPTDDDITQINEETSTTKLTKVVNLQKNKIAELMGYKDLFENAQKKLHKIENTYQDLQIRINELTSENQAPELQAELMRFDANNNDLKAFMDVLQKENNKLAEQFIAWENKIAKVWRETEASGSIDDAKYNELLAEKEALVNQIKEFEQKLKENLQTIADMQKQYEDLETEYMTLYRQQQQSVG